MEKIKKIAPERLQEDACVILDVRTSMEHRQSALDLPHHHIPLNQLEVESFMRKVGASADHPLYLLCRSGNRAAQAAGAFAKAGYHNVYVIEGGLMGCAESGLPVRSGSGISLERQVRIAAGAIVMVSLLLGATLTPYLYVLAGIVGAGLIFSGVTDRCGLALLLTKAPWNQPQGRPTS